MLNFSEEKRNLLMQRRGRKNQSGECQPSVEMKWTTLRRLVLSLLYPLEMDVRACDITQTPTENRTSEVNLSISPCGGGACEGNELLFGKHKPSRQKSMLEIFIF